ncbi:MAG: T9SS type A sorting domain-containing protein [Bacteroidia bacterium]
MIKKLIILFIVIAGVCEKSYGQTNVYHPFPKDSAVWRVEDQSGSMCTGQAPYYSYLWELYQYTLVGDTTIGTYTYKKVYKSGYNENCGYYSSYFAGYAGLMRQDTINKKVYFLIGDTDRLFYDFSKGIGDTLRLHDVWHISTTYSTVINSIDSVLVGSNYHKRFNNGFIEEVGARTGLMEGSNMVIFFEDSWDLVCFNHYTDSYPSGYSCPLLTNTLGIKTLNTNTIFNIYPNPASSSLQVTFSGNIQNTSIEIYNTIGECVHRQIVKSSNCQINVADLAEGVYNLSITTNVGVVNKRLIIVR